MSPRSPAVSEFPCFFLPCFTATCRFPSFRHDGPPKLVPCQHGRIGKSLSPKPIFFFFTLGSLHLQGRSSYLHHHCVCPCSETQAVETQINAETQAEAPTDSPEPVSTEDGQSGGGGSVRCSPPPFLRPVVAVLGMTCRSACGFLCSQSTERSRRPFSSCLNFLLLKCVLKNIWVLECCKCVSVWGKWFGFSSK